MRQIPLQASPRLALVESRGLATGFCPLLRFSNTPDLIVHVDLM